MRRLAADDPEVNEEWICDKGRFGFRYAQLPDRLSTPLVRDRESASWNRRAGPRPWQAAAAGLAAARGRTGVLTGGRLTVEDAYAYAKFARVALDTNDIDFRARAHSDEEADFLAAHVAGRGRDLDGSGLTYAALEKAPAVLLAGFEAEEEAPGVFLRLRKAYRKHGQRDLLARHPRHPGPDEGGRHAAARRARHRDRVAGRDRRDARGWTRTASRPPRRCARRARSSSSASGWRRWRAD